MRGRARIRRLASMAEWHGMRACAMTACFELGSQDIAYGILKTYHMQYRLEHDIAAGLKQMLLADGERDAGASCSDRLLKEVIMPHASHQVEPSRPCL